MPIFIKLEEKIQKWLIMFLKKDLMGRSYATIENSSYFFVTLSCMEAMQNFISHFNQYMVDPSWGKFPAWFDRGLAIDLESYDAQFNTAVIFENEFLENNIFISHPDKHKCNWKIVSTNVTYAPIQINRARNIITMENWMIGYGWMLWMLGNTGVLCSWRGV